MPVLAGEDRGGGAQGHPHARAALEHTVLRVPADVLAADEHRRDRLRAGDVEVLAAAGALPPPHRRQAPRGAGHPAEEVGGEGAVLQRRLVGPPAVAAARRRQVERVQVVAVPVAVGARLPEGSDGDHHQVRVRLGQRGEIEPPLPHLLRPAVFDEHVGLPQQVDENVPSVAAGHVEGDAALVRVEEEEQAALLRVGLVVRERSPAAGGVAASRRLDLDDVRTVVREELRAVGRRHHLPQLDDPDPVQSVDRHVLPLGAKFLSLRSLARR